MSALVRVLPVALCVVALTSCERKSSTPPAEPPGDPMASSDESASRAPALAEAEPEPLASATASGAPETVGARYDACCQSCGEDGWCSDCKVIEAGGACEPVLASCMVLEDRHYCAPQRSDEDIWGGLVGSEIGDDYGVGGLGLVGTGEGGGGTGEGTIGLGNTGLIGKGGGGGTGSGYGRGSGAGFGGQGKPVPRVRQAKAEVAGALDKDIIRRIVRAHINEVRHCYNQALTADPTLAGRFAVQFEISPTGKVSKASVSSNNLADPAVAECTVKAIKKWKFPKPRGGGVVKVTYPFTLSPS